MESRTEPVLKVLPFSSPSPSLLLQQASPAPIIVNTDTLDSVPYVSLSFFHFPCFPVFPQLIQVSLKEPKQDVCGNQSAATSPSALPLTLRVCVCGGGGGMLLGNSDCVTYPSNKISEVTLLNY